MTKHQPALVSELRKVVGAENVLTDPEALSDYERTTFATHQRVPLVVLPADTAEVQAVVRLANEHGAPIYPVSRGRNWGLGSKIPVKSGCVVVDLQRMNRIVELDEKNAVLTVEPGVTFEQVAEHLKDSRLYLPAIGGPADASVLANALERGDGLGPQGDRARYCSGLEVVLPTGELLHTGLSAFPNSLTAKVAQFGLGPEVAGLFFQSNLGIVTRMSVWLGERPKHFQLAVFAAHSEEEVIAATAAVRQLQQQGVVGDTAYSLWNVYRFLTAQIQYPWDAVGGKVVDPKELLGYLPKAWKGVQWVGFLGLYSPSRAHAAASRKLVKKALRGKVTRFFVLSSLMARLGRLFAKPLQRLTGVDVQKMLDTAYFKSAFVGHPTQVASSIYWRKRPGSARTGDPNRDKCGLHWVCVSLPYDGVHIAKITKMVEDAALRQGLEPLSMFFNMSQWCLKSFIVIMFDQEAPGEEEAARRCHDELLAGCDALGYSPVRLGLQSMEQAAPHEAAMVELVHKLKRALDPNDILAPGRYDFRHRWASEGTPSAASKASGA